MPASTGSTSAYGQRTLHRQPASYGTGDRSSLRRSELVLTRSNSFAVCTAHHRMNAETVTPSSAASCSMSSSSVLCTLARKHTPYLSVEYIPRERGTSHGMGMVTLRSCMSMSALSGGRPLPLHSVPLPQSTGKLTEISDQERPLTS